MIACLAAVLLALAPAAVPAEMLAGTYRTDQMEAAASLELEADGTFRYMLDYGAVSEAAEGHWTAQSDAVVLASDAMEITFLGDIERSDAAFDDELLTVEDGALILQRHETIFTFYRAEP